MTAGLIQHTTCKSCRRAYAKRRRDLTVNGERPILSYAELRDFVRATISAIPEISLGEVQAAVARAFDDWERISTL